MLNPRAGFPFLAIGCAFIALGASGRRAFFGAGIVFLILGIVLLKRGARR